MTRRVLAGWLGLTVFVLAVLEIPLGITYQRRELSELTSAVERDAVALAGYAEETLEGDALDELQPIVEGYQARTGGRAVITDAAGISVADSDPPSPGRRDFSTRPEVAEALDGRVSTGRRGSQVLGGDLVFVAVPVTSGSTVVGAVRITYPASEVTERIQRGWLGLGLVAVVTLLAATGAGLLLARSVTRPLRRLEGAAGRLGAGDLEARAPADAGPPEIRSVAGSFNEMAGRIADLVTAQDAFVSDASHQLRTPLTALSLRIENVLDELAEGDPAEAAHELAAARADVDRLARLVDGLLALARAERTAAGTTAEVIDLRSLLAERADAWSAIAGEDGVLVEAEAGPAVRARATPDRLASALDNLLANAVDASPDGATVELVLDAPAGAVELHVLDRGPGMDAEARRRALDRFWSGAGGRLGGTGLGLPIAQKLVRSDGGELDLRPRPGGGLDAVLRLVSATAPLL